MKRVFLPCCLSPTVWASPDQVDIAPPEGLCGPDFRPGFVVHGLFSERIVSRMIWRRLTDPTSRPRKSRACNAGVAMSEDPELLAEAIERLDEATAKMLLERAATESAGMAAAVRLASAGPADRVAILRAEADGVLRTRRHLGYREANEWALDAGGGGRRHRG